MQISMSLWRRRFVLGTVLVLGSLGCLAEPRLARAQPKPAPAKKATPEAQVRAALEDAIQRLDAGDALGFIEYYLPTEELRQMRRAKVVARVAEGIKSQPNQLAAIRERLVRAALSKSLTFDDSESVVSIDLTAVDAPIDAPKAPAFVEPATTAVVVTGYGADLNTVLGKAIAALETGKIDEFVAKMFPVGALREPGADERLATVVKTFKATPKLLEPMVADLKAMQSLKPNLVENGNTAVFALEGAAFATPAANSPPKAPNRTVKLQRVDGNWRLADNTTAARKTIAQQMTNALPEVDLSSSNDVLTLERFGDGWRLAPRVPGH